MTSKKNNTTFTPDNNVYKFEQFEEFECVFGNSQLLSKWGVKQGTLLPIFDRIIVKPAELVDGKKKSVRATVVGRKFICEALGLSIPEWGAVWTFFFNPSFDKSELKAAVGGYLRNAEGEVIVDEKNKKSWIPKIVIEGLDERTREDLYGALKAIASDLSGKEPYEKINRTQR